MIIPFSHHNLIKILIPIHHNPSSPFFTTTRASLLLLLVLLSSLFLFSSGFSSSSSFHAMKVHPAPTKKRNNITIQFSRNPQNLSTTGGGGSSHKKLRRLPHIFTRVLELPFRSDADVAIEESPDCFKFVAETDGIGEVRAHMIQIHPGVTKIVIRPNGSVELSSLDELELDMWRFRLPETTRPELASAVYVDGELIVTVPKGGEMDGFEERDGGVAGDGVGGGGGGGRAGEFRGGMGNTRLVLVQ